MSCTRLQAAPSFAAPAEANVIDDEPPLDCPYPAALVLSGSARGYKHLPSLRSTAGLVALGLLCY